jgi:hypothetical protein
MEGKLQKARPPFEKSNRNIPTLRKAGLYHGVTANDSVGPYRKGFSASPSPTLRTGLILISLRFGPHGLTMEESGIMARVAQGGGIVHVLCLP